MRDVFEKCPTLTGSLKTWAQALGCHPDTLRKRLRLAGYDVTTARRWAAHEVFDAWVNDKVAATTREANARAEKIEFETRATRRQLDALQARSESEHPVQLAAAGDDVVRNRETLRSIWDEIRDMLQELGEHLREEDPE